MKIEVTSKNIAAVSVLITAGLAMLDIWDVFSIDGRGWLSFLVLSITSIVLTWLKER